MSKKTFRVVHFSTAPEARLLDKPAGRGRIIPRPSRPCNLGATQRRIATIVQSALYHIGGTFLLRRVGCNGLALNGTDMPPPSSLAAQSISGPAAGLGPWGYFGGGPII